MIDIIATTTTLILNGKYTGSSPLTLTTFGFVLYSWLCIEIHFNEFTFVKLDKIVNPVKTLFNKSKRLYLHYVIFFHKKLWMFTISSTSVAS